MGKYTEDEINKAANELNDSIQTLPVDGIFKIRINNPVSAYSKLELTFLMKELAKNLGRPDITIVIESAGDLN